MTGSSSTIRMRAPGVTAPAGADATSGAAALGHGASVPLDLRDRGVVVARVVMREREPLHPGCAGELHDVVERAVSPVLPCPVLLGRVLRVVDDEIGVGQEAGVTAVALVEDRFDPPGRGIAAPEGAAERLVVARVDDRGAVGLEAVAERHGG